MTLDELKATPQFAALQPQQQAYVVAFCSNGGNDLAAAREAYPKVKEASLRVIANRNRGHKGIKRLVDTFMGISPALDKLTKDELLVDMSRRMKNPQIDDKIYLGLVTLYGKWEGFEIKPTPPAAPSEAAVPSLEDTAAAELLKELGEE
jgi:hypothetical protein